MKRIIAKWLMHYTAFDITNIRNNADILEKRIDENYSNQSSAKRELDLLKKKVDFILEVPKPKMQDFISDNLVCTKVELCCGKSVELLPNSERNFMSGLFFDHSSYYWKLTMFNTKTQETTFKEIIK